MKTLISQNGLIFNPPMLGGLLYLPGIPGGGSKLYDRSPYGNHGTITGATWKYQNGLWYPHFDGTDDFVNCGTGASLNFGSGDWTVKAWAYCNTVAANKCIVSKTHSGAVFPTNYRGWHLDYIFTGNLFSIWVCDGVNQLSVNVTAIFNTWVHLVATRSGNTLYLYKNAGTPATGDVTGLGNINSTDPFRIGRDFDANPAFWNGGIALVQVYNRALNALEIQNHYQREKHLLGVC